MNKKIVSAIVAGVATLSASAQLTDGFYRIQNVTTKRYVSMQDNKGQIYAQQTDVDAAALRTITDYDKVLSDAGSVVYVHGVGSNQYDISAQGTSLHSMINYYIKLTKQSNGSYYAWQENSGQRIYLSDIDDGEPEAYVYARDKTTRGWNFLPVSASSANYLAINPTVAAEGKYHATFYCGFSFTPVTSGMHVYYVSKVDEAKGMAVYKPVGSIVPPATPVFVECNSKEMSDNRIELSSDKAASLSSNQLKGVYFNINDYRYSGHVNHVAYDAKTMRVLGVCSDGSVGFVTSKTLDYIPANTAYLKVSESAPEEIKLVSESEYATNIHSVGADTEAASAVYTLTGVKVLDGGQSIASLPAGVYIQNGKKIIKR